MDYCTLWPDGSWGHCCKAHDLAYETGVPSKAMADWELWVCVAQQSPVMASIMLVGVSTFGFLFWKRKKK